MTTEKRLIYLDEAIAKIKDDGLLGSGYSDDERMDDVIDMLESCHIVNAAEVVHGRWKNVKETEVYSPDHRCTFTHTAQTCSVCNVRIGFIGAKFYLYDAYCPSCGAKMDGDGEWLKFATTVPVMKYAYTQIPEEHKTVACGNQKWCGARIVKNGTDTQR